MDVAANNVPLSSLLKEACDVCQKQCVIEMDNKQKVSYALKEVGCKELFSYLEENIEVEVLGDVFVFRKGGKNGWEGYRLLHRQPSMLEKEINKLLPGKQVVLADDASGTLWVPRGFYQQNLSLLEKMDVPRAEYTVHLSWLRLHQSFYQDLAVDKTPMLNWALGRPVSIGLQEVMRWVSGLEKEGKVSEVSQVLFRVQEGVETKTVLTDLQQQWRRDKKGARIELDVPQVTEVLANVQEVSGGLQLSLDLVDGRFVSEEVSKHSELKTNTTVLLERETSLLLTGFSFKRRAISRHCVPFLGRVPFFGRLFCHENNREQMLRYALVVSIV